MIAVPKKNQIDAVVFSNFILKHYGPMSHLKLQKLLFYCDAYCLAFFDKELIPDRFEAWVHGPVCRRVYDAMKGASVLYTEMEYSPIPGVDEDAEFDALPSDIKDLTIDVLNNLNKWTSYQLELATHSEQPWREAREGYGEADRCHVELSKETTRNYYRRQQGL